MKNFTRILSKFCGGSKTLCNSPIKSWKDLHALLEAWAIELDEIQGAIEASAENPAKREKEVNEILIKMREAMLKSNVSTHRILPAFFNIRCGSTGHYFFEPDADEVKTGHAGPGIAGYTIAGYTRVMPKKWER